MALYFCVIFSAAVIKYWQLAMGYDLAFNEQAIWNTVHGRILEISGVDYSRTILGNDQFLFYLLLTPVYALAPGTYTLFALATLGAALGALPLFLLARRLLGGGAVPLAISLAYLLHPALQNPNLYEFQVRIFAATSLLFALHFLEAGKFWPMVVALGLAASTRSDVGLAVAGLGIYALVAGKGPGFGLAAVAMGLGFFLSGVFLVVPGFSTAERFTFARHYQQVLAGGVPSALTELIRPQKLRYLAMLFGSVSFIPLAAPLELVPALPALALNLLSPRSIQWDLYHQYQLPILPFLFLAAIKGIGRLSRTALRYSAAAAILAAVLVVTYLNGGNQALAYLKKGFAPSQDYLNAVALAQQIPPGAFVAASNLLGPIAMPRQGLVLLARNPLNSMEPLRQAEYVLLDTSDRASMDVIREQGVLDGKMWVSLDRRGRFILLKRSEAVP
jgi:uncharacterized membrane protein